MPAAIAPAIAAWLIPAGATALQMALIEIGVGLALSALSRAILGKPDDAGGGAGLRTDVTMEGGTIPQTMIVGHYATGGTIVAPFYATGRSDDVDNAFRYYIIDIADFPIDKITAIWINDTKFLNPTDFEGDITVSPRKANATTKPEWAEDDNLLVRAHLGRQTTADGYLVGQLAGHAKRPWTNTFVGVGVAYIWVCLRLNQELVQGEAQIKVECDGARLYNRSLDTTNGGSGTQRENDVTTHLFVDNPITIVENIMHGIPLADGRVWGLGVEWGELPYSNWQTAKNTGNTSVGTGANSRQRYNCGYEIRMATADNGGDDPFTVIDELLKGCSGSIVDVGGTFYVRAGPPALPIVTISDDDIYIDRPQDFTIHEGLKDTYNTMRARFPNRKQAWKPSEAPLYSNSSWITEDGEMLLADMQFNAVYDQRQIEQLQREYVKDSRRLRRHTIVLPKRYSYLIPLNVFSWNSVKNGYSAKSFEILEVGIDTTTLAITISCREIDPNDYNPGDFIDRSDPDDQPIVYNPGPLPGFAAQGVTIVDGTGGARRPGIQYTWPKKYSGVNRISIDLRVKANSADAPDFSITNIGKLKATQAAGILPNTLYQYRVKSNRSKYSNWIDVLTPNVKLTDGDVDMPGADGDGLPASDPTGISVVGMIRAIWINWANNPEPDLIRYNIHHRADSTLPANPVVHLTAAAGHSYTAINTNTATPPAQLNDNQTRYVWVQAVDSDGPSNWVGPYEATTLPKLGITSAILQNMIDATSFATGLNPVEILDGATAFPKSTRRAQDIVIHGGEIYRWDPNAAGGAKYVKSIKAADLIDKIVAGQIEVGAVGAAQMAAGALSAKHVGVFDFESRQPVFKFNDNDATLFAADNGTLAMSTGAASSGYALALTKTTAANSGQAVVNSDSKYRFDVDADQVYWVEAKAREHNGVTRTGAWNFGLVFYDNTGNVLSYVTNDIDSANQDGPFDTATTAYSRKMKKIAVPAGAVQASCRGSIPTERASGTAIRFDRIIPRLANAGELAVDGTITGNKLDVATLAATLANIGTAYISRAHVVDGEIVRAKIGDAAIGNAQIGNAEIDYLKLRGTTVAYRGAYRWQADRAHARYFDNGYRLTDATKAAPVVLFVFYVPRKAGFKTRVNGSFLLGGWGTDATISLQVQRKDSAGVWQKMPAVIATSGFRGRAETQAFIVEDANTNGVASQGLSNGRSVYRVVASKYNGITQNNADVHLKTLYVEAEHYRANNG